MHYCLANDLPTLVWAANLADLELHTSLSKKTNIARPTMMVFDLDPGPPADIVQCCQIGVWLRELLDGMKLRAFAKTSGSKGLQVYVPLNTAVTYDQTKGLSRSLAQRLERDHPDRVTSNMQRVSQTVQLLTNVNRYEQKFGIVQVMSGLEDAGDSQFFRKNHIA